MTPLTTTLGRIADLDQDLGKSGLGHYFLSHSEERVSKTNQRFQRLTLDDASGRAFGFIWPESFPCVTLPLSPGPVTVHGRVQTLDGRVQLHIKTLAPLVLDEVQLASELLPRADCPERARPALERLSRLERDLPAPLDGFLRRVLLDPVITLPLMRCRSSVTHHHAYPGGLLVHSTAMLDEADALTRKIIPSDAWSPYIAQLGYLLHDLGKLRSVGETCRPTHALVVRHELLSIELLAPHLRWLEQRAPELAMAIRYVLAHLATPAKAREAIPNYVVAEIVDKLDQLSAATHNQRDLGQLLAGPAKDDRQTSAGRSTVSEWSKTRSLRAAS